MTRQKISSFLRWLFKTILIIIGFIIIIMPFFPAFMEYFFGAPERDFSTKEVTIISLGILIFTGGLFSNTIINNIKKIVGTRPDDR